MSWWSSVLPSHREVVAVNYLPHLMRAWDRPQVSHDWVEQLASGEGPAGDATALLLAFFLAQEKPRRVCGSCCRRRPEVICPWRRSDASWPRWSDSPRRNCHT
ncbi:hypothetical protein ACFQX6_00925 [Streptosporangium lutulentum]